jgi:hypothetical protein
MCPKEHTELFCVVPVGQVAQLAVLRQPQAVRVVQAVPGRCMYIL